MIPKIVRWAFLLLIVSLPLVRPTAATLGGLRVPLTDFIFVGVFLAFLAGILTRQIRPRFSRLYVFIGFYALALTVSTALSTAPTRSVYKLAGEFYLFALAVVAFHLAAAERDFLKPLSRAFAFGAGLTALASAAGFALFYAGLKTTGDNYFLSHFGSLPAGNYPRLHALFANANMMTNYLNVALAFVMLAGARGWLPKIAARLLAGGIWAAAFFTFSAGLGGLFLTAGIWHAARFFRAGRRLAGRVTLVLAIGAAVFFLAAALASPDTENSAREFEIPLTGRVVEPSVRVLVWQSALEIWRQNPLFGRGTGTDAAFLQYRTLSGDRQILLDAHQNWLNVAGQTGLFGLAAFVALGAFLFGRMRFSVSSGEPAADARLAISAAVAGAFFYQGLTGSFEDARHLWILFGLLAAFSEPAADEGRTE